MAMRQSEEVRDAMLRFCERLSAGDVASFDELVSQEATLIIGTTPGEWVTERNRMRFGFEAEGVRLEAKDPVGYEEGSLGWVVDQPAFVFPDGSAMQTRLRVQHMIPGKLYAKDSPAPSRAGNRLTAPKDPGPSGRCR
jgi:hypothetical protein